jgi:hypothetical protein
MGVSDVVLAPAVDPQNTWLHALSTFTHSIYDSI